MSVTKDDLVFASAHFITIAGHRCEGLHGHHNRAQVAIEGELEQGTGWVVDFVEVKEIMRRLCGEIDHLVRLAQLLADRLRAAHEARRASGLTAIEMDIEENFGQSAVCRLTLK